ncbi:MAG: phage tail protein [Chloroflexi bacterium]|nr:phage tail protein [Chloroflexota bacterium]
MAFIIAAPIKGPYAGDFTGNYSFRVEIEGVDAGLFTSVDGLSVEQEVIEYQSGGEQLIRKLPGRLKYANITLKRGLIAPNILNDWIEQSLERSRKGEVPERKSGSIIILDQSGNDVARFNFFQGWPCRYEGPKLDSSGTGGLAEEMVICIEYFEQARG